MINRSYSELRRLDSFEDRFDYLMLGGGVGVSTFGFDRWINQEFYRSREWKMARQHAILRDQGCDLGVEGYEIHAYILIHHMNPMSADDVKHGQSWITDPEFLITTTRDTHNAIHFGDKSKLRTPHVDRTRGDTRLW